MKKICKECKTNKTWKGTDPECGFTEDGNFTNKNFMCYYIQKLRNEVDGQLHYNYEAESTMKVIIYDIYFVVLCWYKDRGRTPKAFMMNEDEHLPLTLDICKEIIEKHEMEN